MKPVVLVGICELVTLLKLRPSRSVELRTDTHLTTLVSLSDSEWKNDWPLDLVATFFL